MNKEQLAKWLHDNYEEVAKEKDWNTQENCKVEFDTLPDANKQTMIEIAKRLLDLHNVSDQRELLCAFFKFFRDNGEANIGMTIEQFVDDFLAQNNR